MTRFRFTIRELMMLTALICCAFGWFLDRTHLAKVNDWQRRAAFHWKTEYEQANYHRQLFAEKLDKYEPNTIIP